MSDAAAPFLTTGTSEAPPQDLRDPKEPGTVSWTISETIGRGNRDDGCDRSPGHLGNNLVRLLLEKGEKVRAMVLAGEDLTSLKGLMWRLSRGCP